MTDVKVSSLKSVEDLTEEFENLVNLLNQQKIQIEFLSLTVQQKLEEGKQIKKNDDYEAIKLMVEDFRTFSFEQLKNFNEEMTEIHTMISTFADVSQLSLNEEKVNRQSDISKLRNEFELYFEKDDEENLKIQ